MIILSRIRLGAFTVEYRMFVSLLYFLVMCTGATLDVFGGFPYLFRLDYLQWYHPGVARGK